MGEIKYEILHLPNGMVTVGEPTTDIRAGYFCHPNGSIFPVTPLYIQSPISSGLMRPVIAAEASVNLEGVPLLPPVEDEAILAAGIYAQECQDHAHFDQYEFDMVKASFKQGYKAAQQRGTWTDADMIDFKLATTSPNHPLYKAYKDWARENYYYNSTLQSIVDWYKNATKPKPMAAIFTKEADTLTFIRYEY